MAQTLPSLHLVFLFTISLFSKINGLSLEMIPIDSPYLQILPKHVTVQQRHQFLLNISMSRVKNYPITLTLNGLKSPLEKLTKQYYYVTRLPLGSGQGRLSPYMLIDTACQKTWVQCEGCNPCIETKAENFKYKMSRSFTRVSVDDPLCNPRLTYEGSCGIDIKYSSSHAVGFLGRDNAYFQDAKTGESIGFSGFAFGCALKNKGFVFDNNMRDNAIVGILGLSFGSRSFLSQLDAKTNGRFSYCLAPDRGLSTMYFGDEAQISGDATREVKTIAMNPMFNYHIYVKGISVDGMRLPIDLSVFELDTIRFSTGFFVDSGAPYTFIPKSVYNTLKAAVIMYFRHKYDWLPVHLPHIKKSNLCYETYPSDVHGLPSVIFHFAGSGQQGEIDWVMDNNYLFTKIHEGFCMTIFSLENPGPSLFGAYQQNNFKILFDVVNGLLSFVPQICQEATL